MLDNVTRLDGATAGPGKMLTLRITVASLTASTAPPQILFQTQWGPDIKLRARASEIRRLLNHNITVKYIYHEGGGSPFGEIRVVRADRR